MSTPFIVEACKTPEQEDYVLKLSASSKVLSAKITLKACLTLVTETWLHTWACKSSPVDDAMIHFYSCDSKGNILKELGQAETNACGIATFSWTIKHPGNYWFVAQYTSEDGHEHDGHS
jgi:hypothetical protein